MPYVTRNKKGEISSIHASPPPNAKAEWIEPEKMEELVEFLNTSREAEHSYSFLASSDLELIRVLEDLIDLLCEKHIIAFTELPETAQQKLGTRKKVRENMSGITLINEDEKGII